MGDDNSVPITYETLFEILRLEKNREELQELDKDFYKHVVQYLKEKQGLLEKKKHDADLFAADEIKKIQVQIDNIHRIMKDLHTRREKKILNLAWNKARTNSSLITSKNLLEEEKQLYNNLTSHLIGFRNGVLLNILQLNMPTLDQIPSKVIQRQNENQNQDERQEEKTEAINETQEKELEAEEKNEETGQQETQQIQDVKKVTFKNSTPKFVGTNLEVYGPFDKGDSAELPEKIANVLVNKGRAELSS